MLYCRLLIFFFKSTFSKNYFRNTIRVSNSWDPDLGSKCLQWLSADGTTIKPVLSGHLKIDKTKVLMENGSLMKVVSILMKNEGSITRFMGYCCDHHYTT